MCLPVAREGRAVSRCLAEPAGSHPELADSRLELEGSLLEGRWPRDKGEVDRPSTDLFSQVLPGSKFQDCARAAFVIATP